MRIKTVAFSASAAAKFPATALWHGCCRSAPVRSVISTLLGESYVILQSSFARCKPEEPQRIPGEKGRGEVHIVAERLRPVVAATPGIGSGQDGSAGIEGGLNIKRPDDQFALPPTTLIRQSENPKSS